MNDTDFIKKCCEYADGEIIYPLILQRTIEGVNDEHADENDDGFYISIERDCVVVSLGWSFDDKYFYFANYEREKNPHDAAKRSALEYIFTREEI